MVPRSSPRVKLASSLRTEIVFKVIVLTVTVVLLVSVVAFKILELEVLGQRLRSANQVIVALHHELTLADPVAAAIPSKGASHPQGITERFLRAGNLEALYLLDASGRIFAHPDSELIGKLDDDPLVQRSLDTDSPLTSLRENRFGLASYLLRMTIADSVRIVIPLRAPGGDRATGVAIVPLGDVKRSIARSMKILLAFIAVDVFIVVIFGSWFLSRAVVRPLDRLSRAAEAISGGSLTQEVPVESGNEIGLLGESFNTMSQRLRESRERIDQQVKRLEATNAELERAQGDLIKSEKLASVGRLAAGIAHEIGNPLSCILGLTDVLLGGGRSQAGLPPEVRQHVGQIQKETGRIHGIIRRLLDFSRPAKAEIKEVTVNDTVRETLRLAAPIADFRQVETTLALDPANPRVKTDRSLLEQVLLNLLLNAGQAMPDGGNLRISTRCTRFEARKVVSLRRADDPIEGDYQAVRKTGSRLNQGSPVVEIEVADSGCGIAPAHLSQIFDPFFTTKEPGQGTGLGLAVVHGILELLGGSIRVKSDPGKGTSFTVTLPLEGSRP